MDGIQSWNQLLDFLTHVVTIAGVPVGIGVFLWQKRRERLEREMRAFDELDAAYVKFMELCLEHPDLDVFPSREAPTTEPGSRQSVEEEALLAILISLFERVFLAYDGHSETFRSQQWTGWKLFMKSYSGRENVQRVWDKIGQQFDTRFQKFAAAELFRTTLAG